MNSLELQEKTIYTYLLPFLSDQGYNFVNEEPTTGDFLIPGEATLAKEFRKNTPGGFKSVIFSLTNQGSYPIVNIHLGVRFNLIESFVGQFIKEVEFRDEPYTLMASLHRFNHPPLPKLLLTDEASLKFACKQIGDFMQKKGFRFLNSFDRIKRIDAILNRNPLLFSPYVNNQVHRCFKGIALARLVHRTNFESLCTVYRKSLHRQLAPQEVIENYTKLVNYLKCFSFN